jgi:hypothetical protein
MRGPLARCSGWEMERAYETRHSELRSMQNLIRQLLYSCVNYQLRGIGHPTKRWFIVYINLISQWEKWSSIIFILLFSIYILKQYILRHSPHSAVTYIDQSQCVHRKNTNVECRIIQERRQSIFDGI